MTASTPSPEDERRLVQAARDGDDSAFVTLIQRHQRLMQQVARSLLGEAHAEDVVQEAWVAVYRALPGFEGRSSFKTWVVTIVSNEAKSRLRREKRAVSLESLAPAWDDDRFKPNGHWHTPPRQWHWDSPDALLEENQLRLCLEKTLRLLPDQQKAVFRLRELEQTGFDEVAELLAISQANARVLLHRARGTLAQVIDRYRETGQC